MWCVVYFFSIHLRPALKWHISGLSLETVLALSKEKPPVEDLLQTHGVS